MSADATPTEAVLPPLPPRAVGMIWAQAADGVIGDGGGMPWKAPEDMAYYRATTWGHPVVMGRRTWDSVPARFRPFPGRTNIVLTRDAAASAEIRAAGAMTAETLDDALAEASTADGSEITWVVGGGAVYAAALARADVLSITVLDLEVDGDTHAPVPGDDFRLFAASPRHGYHGSDRGPGYRFETWVRVR